MTKQIITAFFDSREYATNAMLMLRQAGIAASDVTVSPETTASDDTMAGDRPATGFWASLEDLFGGSDDHATYSEGLRRGGIMIVAHVDDAKVDEAVHVLEQHGSVDLDERETTWKSEGWTGGSSALGAPATGSATGALGATRTTEQAALGADARASATPMRGASSAVSSRTGTAADDVLQVVEEKLNVGKRAVNRGKVRIHSYVVETPFTETVNLRDETVSVDRHPVDRILGAADLGVDAFKDRTIEMQEIDEEAVIAKTTRVVEEIGLRKEVTERAQTITDTVRSTQVDIEDSRTPGTRTGLVSGFTADITDGMEVVGSDGHHVGAVDHLDGASIKLKRVDPSSGGAHHLIPVDWIKSVDTKVTLKTSASETKKRWTAV